MPIEINLIDEFDLHREDTFKDHSEELYSTDYNQEFKKFAQMIEPLGFICLPSNINWHLSIYDQDRNLQAFGVPDLWIVISSNIVLQMVLPLHNPENFIND